MFNFHMIQAEHGDCFILEYGTHKKPKYILIDGGPETIYEHHLRNELQKINQKGEKLDLIISTHVDNDHIIGLTELFVESYAKQKIIAFDQLWYNSFGKSFNIDDKLEKRIKKLLIKIRDVRLAKTPERNVHRGISQGEELKQLADLLDININKKFKGNLISLENPSNPIKFDNLKLFIIGPTKKTLDKLKGHWEKWITDYEKKLMHRDVEKSLIKKADDSIPNLSSIMVLAEVDNKSILLTGDGLGKHIIDGLTKLRLLDKKGKLKVDVLKLPHHGSDRNVTVDFFRTILADKYIISGNGYHGNPEFPPLKWIVEVANEQNREIEIYVTNITNNIKKLLNKYKPKEYNYKLIVIDKNASSMKIKLSG